MENWLSRLWARFGTGKKESTSGRPPVRWLSPQENPFGVEVLDCRAFAAMQSFTKNRDIAVRYARLRNSSGEELRGTSPQNARNLECKLWYPVRHRPHDGPMFKSEVMEDKWDIYLYDGYLYFQRSWTGDLVFRAEVEFEDEKARVTAIQTSSVDGDLTSSDEDHRVLQEVDFLIKSHLMNLAALHPLPKHMIGKDPFVLAAHSSATFGRRALYGTFEDTLATRTM